MIWQHFYPRNNDRGKARDLVFFYNSSVTDAVLKDAPIREIKSIRALCTVMCSEIGEVHLFLSGERTGDAITREERNESPGPRTSLSNQCYWPRIDGTLRLQFNIFNELAYQRENRVSKASSPLCAEYLLLPLSAGNIVRTITHHALVATCTLKTNEFNLQPKSFWISEVDHGDQTDYREQKIYI